MMKFSQFFRKVKAGDDVYLKRLEVEIHQTFVFQNQVKVQVSTSVSGVTHDVMGASPSQSLLVPISRVLMVDNEAVGTPN